MALLAHGLGGTGKPGTAAMLSGPTRHVAVLRGVTHVTMDVMV